MINKKTHLNNQISPAITWENKNTCNIHLRMFACCSMAILAPQTPKQQQTTCVYFYLHGKISNYIKIKELLYSELMKNTINTENLILTISVLKLS